MPKAAQLAARYIANHPAVRDCLAMDTVNYSKLARQIISRTGISAKSTAAVIVACRRHASLLRKAKKEETGIDVLRKSRKSIRIANRKASITFTINEKQLPGVLELLG